MIELNEFVQMIGGAPKVISQMIERIYGAERVKRVPLPTRLIKQETAAGCCELTFDNGWSFRFSQKTEEGICVEAIGLPYKLINRLGASPEDWKEMQLTS